MILSNFNDIKVIGIATAVPKNREVLSEKYDAILGAETVANFSKVTGVIERRLSLPEQTSSDFAFVAAEKLLAEKHINRAEIGVCIFVTQTPDYRYPATACVLHKRLGLGKDCIAFDVNLGCSGYVYGMQIASSLMETTNCKYGLLLVGDTSNKRLLCGYGVAPRDTTSVMLFGEGGSATLLEKRTGSTPITTTYKTDGSGFRAIVVPAGGFRNVNAPQERSLWGDGNERSDYELYMNGVEVFTFTITEVPAMINEFIETNGMDRDSFDCYAFHQANCYIFKQLIKKAKLPKDKLHISMDRYGNTSVTSIPLTICDRYGASDGTKDLNIFSCGFGIGLSWGIATFNVNEKDIFPIIETDDFYKDGQVSHE